MKAIGLDQYHYVKSQPDAEYTEIEKEGFSAGAQSQTDKPDVEIETLREDRLEMASRFAPEEPPFGKEFEPDKLKDLFEKATGFKGKFHFNFSAVSAAQLHARLQGAVTSTSARGVIFAASSAISAYKRAAAFDKNGRGGNSSEIAKLERLIQNAGTKIRSLDEEDALGSRRKKAEILRRQEKAEQLKEELRRKRAARKLREMADRPPRSSAMRTGCRVNQDYFEKMRAEEASELQVAQALETELNAAVSLEVAMETATDAPAASSDGGGENGAPSEQNSEGGASVELSA